MSFKIAQQKVYHLHFVGIDVGIDEQLTILAIGSLVNYNLVFSKCDNY